MYFDHLVNISQILGGSKCERSTPSFHTWLISTLNHLTYRYHYHIWQD